MQNEVDRLEIIIEAEAKKASAELDRMISKLNQVSSVMGKATGFSFGNGVSGIGNAANSMSRYTKATSGAVLRTRSLTSELTRLAAGFYLIRRAVDGVGGSIKKSMDIGETINLFQTSYKKIGMETAAKAGMEWGSEAADQFARKFIDKAQDFNNILSDALTLDPNLMMNYQAVFAQMTNSMGLVAQSSMNISSSFLMLGNDIASLWNIDTDKAMKKLQSGLAGQIRPLRELGIDISQTSLEMTALNYGIQDNIKDMSQAAKVQLRWLSIMDQAEVAFGDMAKTIDSPANQLRVLNQQWTNLSRSIGSVFLPAITHVLPYINATVIALRRMIDTLATAMGYEMPDYSDSNIYKDVASDLIDIEDGANGAYTASEKLRKSIMGFDELNILSERTSLKNGMGSGYAELDKAINDKTISYMSKFTEEMSKMSNKAKDLADEIQPKIESFVRWLDKISPALEGIAAAFITYKVLTWFGDLATKVGALSMSPVGVIALAVGALWFLVDSVKEHNKKMTEIDLAKRFGNIVLSLKEVEEIAKTLTETEYSAKIDIYVTEKSKLSEIEKNIEADLKKLNKLNWKVSVGMKLTEGEISDYKATIESFIKNTNAYIEQQHYVTTLAIDAVINDANFKSEITAIADKYFNGSKGEMERLGRDLRSEMDKALADGVLDATEKKVISNLVKEMNEVVKGIADAEFKAKLQMITVEGDLSPKSFKDLTKKIQEIIEERTKKAEEATFTVLAAVNGQYAIDMKNATTQAERNKIQREYEKNVTEITKELSQTKATITLDGTNFSLETLLKNYSDALDKVSPRIASKTTDVFTRDVLKQIEKMDPKTAIGSFTSGLVDNYKDALATSGLNSASQRGLKQMLDALEPTTEQYQKIYDDALKAGNEVPAGVSGALTDINNLKALTGDMEAIAYLIGQKLSTDPVFLQTLAKCETAGKDINLNLIAGLKSKIPDLKLAGDKLIFDLDKSIESASKTSKKDNMPVYAMNIIDGYSSTFTKDKSGEKAVQGWLNGINNVISNHKLPELKQVISMVLDDSGIKSTGITLLDQRYAQFALGKQYANGGFPDAGEVFVAREAGPELVGQIGGRNAVMNNGQIVQSVSQGVAGAVANVLVPVLTSNRGQAIENIMYLDSEVIYHAYNQAKNSNNHRFYPVEQGG